METSYSHYYGGNLSNGRSLKSVIVTNALNFSHSAEKVGNCVIVDILTDRQAFTSCVTGPYELLLMARAGRGPLYGRDENNSAQAF